MNPAIINLMLSTKNVYILLLICVTQLGCSSASRYQMDVGDKSSSSSSKGKSTHSVDKGNNNVQLMHEKVKKFFEKEDFEKGSPINNEEFNLIIKKLGKSIDISGADKEYNEFLNQYGCIYGEGFEICGPTEDIIDSKEKTKYIVSIQRGFENRCRTNGMTDEKIKTCWLIAEIDQDDQYYINFDKDKKYLIYSMGLDGTCKPFAINFLEFLDKFFEAYRIKTEGKGSDSDSY